MRKLLLAVVSVAALLAVEPAHAQQAHGAAPTWTILRQVCWKISETAGQCAVGLYGAFPTRDACLAANAGQLETKAQTRDGRQVGQRCEIKLEGAF